MSSVFDKLKEHGIIPEIISTAPENVRLATISYPSEVEASLGEELTPSQVGNNPKVSWEADPENQYCLLFVDPDAPCRTDPKKHACKHWMVVNIPGSQVEKGYTEVEYVGCGPPEGSGLHRYIFLVFKQSKPLPTKNYTSGYELKGRVPFDTKKFVEDNRLELVAANFFQAQYDESVKELEKRMLKFPYVFFNIYQIACLKLFH